MRVQQVKYNLAGGFEETQLKQIHQMALRILDEVGIEIHSREITEKELLGRISSYEGVIIRGGRICFAPFLVERYLNDFQRQIKAAPSAPKHDVTIAGTCHTFNILDPETGHLRLHDTSDLIRATQLMDSFYEENVRGGCPGIPSDVPASLQYLMQYKICCEHSRSSPAVPITSVSSAEYIYEMKQVMGYASPDSYGVSVHPVSPLRLEGVEFEIALHFFKKFGKKLSIGSCPMPIMGVSAPIFFPAALAQAIAEGLAGFVFFKLLTDGGNVSFGFNFYAFDMKYCNFTYGGPEDVLISFVRDQMCQWYGLSSSLGAKSLLTMSHQPDAQAAAEKAAKTSIAVLAGASQIVDAGSLSLDETFSPEQLVIDMEIVNWSKRVAQGVQFDDEYDYVQIIKEAIGQGGDFLSHPTTLENYRETYWMPSLFEHLMKNQWLEKGGKKLREKAREIVKKKMDAPHFVLDSGRQKALDGIYKKAAKEFGSL